MKIYEQASSSAKSNKHAKVTFNNAFKYLMLTACLSIGYINIGSAAIVTSDFSFGSGVPFGGTTTLGNIDVTLTTTNTEPFTSTSFRDQLNLDPAFVTFEFSAPVNEFSLTVDFVLPPDEFLTNFNIGDPTTLTGTLVNIGGDVTSSQPGDFGNGSLIWTGINTSIVSFTIGNNPLSVATRALEIVEFGIPNAVPIPPAVWLFGSGLLGMIGIARRKESV